jgi:Selenocysteine lyase
MSDFWFEVRSQFPALEQWVFLNTATYGQLPRRAVEAMQAHLERRDQFACADFLEWFDDADRIREQLGRLIGCAPDDIAFIPNASTALSTLLTGLRWEPGDRIVTLENEFPNNLYIPALCQGHGVEFVESRWEDLYRNLTPRTRLVAISTVNYSTGFRPPIEEVSARLRERGILLYLDGTQSVGALRLDIRAVKPSMVAVDAYKWLLAPNGAAFMYVSPELRKILAPAVVGWRSDRGWRQVNCLSHGVPIFKESAEKYEGGMLNFPSLYAMQASVEMMLEIGPERIERRVLELADLARDILRSKGAVILHNNSPIVAARFENRDAAALAQHLKSLKILVSARHGNLRVSTHFYNTEADLDALAANL